MKVFLFALGTASAVAVRDRFCPIAKKSFLQVTKPTEKEVSQEEMDKRSALPFDGYFEVGCFLEQTPEARTMKFKKTARGSSAAAVKERVTPQMCFNYCRDKSTEVAVAEELLEGADINQDGVEHTVRMNFFSLTKGKECACHGGPQLTASGGGMGKCDAPCEGDNSKMCGNSDGKSTVYAMHHCLGGERHDDALKLVGKLSDLNDFADANVARLEGMLESGFKVVEGLPVAASRQFLGEQLGLLRDAKRDLAEANAHTKEAHDALDTHAEAYNPNAPGDSAALASADEAVANATEAQTLGHAAERAFKDFDKSVSLGNFLAENGMGESKLKTSPTSHMDLRRAPGRTDAHLEAGQTYLVEGDAAAFYYTQGNQDRAEYMCASACEFNNKCVAYNIILTESANKDWMCSMKKNVKKVVIFPDESGKMAATGGINLDYYNNYEREIEWDRSHVFAGNNK